jgi:hypothetical protein
MGVAAQDSSRQGGGGFEPLARLAGRPATSLENLHPQWTLMGGYPCLITAVYHASILTSTLLPDPVPCSQNRIGSPAWARS